VFESLTVSRTASLVCACVDTKHKLTCLPMAVAQVLPYLIRRAQENGDVIGRAAGERKMLVSAFLKRLFFSY
jgi:hypothetical protein